MTIHTPFFDYGYSAGSLVDIGRKRTSNQDEVIVCPEAGFYAVSDGMGGLLHGDKTSQLIREAIPQRMKDALRELLISQSPENAAKLLKQQICEISSMIYHTGNSDRRFEFGATLSGVWLTDHHAVFVNLGDSRGYLLPRYGKKIRQITNDHNVAAMLVQMGEITKEEARYHPGSSKLTRFVGTNPALPDVFIREIRPGDKILLCSDGLYGMVDDSVLQSIMRSVHNPDSVCGRLVEKANANGGADNISVVYIEIVKPPTHHYHD